MEPRKNVFSYFVIIVYVAAVLYILISGVTALANGQEYPYLQQGIFLVLFVVLWLILNGITGVLAGFEIRGSLKNKERFLKYTEAVVVIVVLAAGAFLRIAYIGFMPMEPESHYKIYYEIADLISRGTLLTEGVEYCDYIAAFPHIYGYSYILSMVFRIFGTSVQTAQYFNVALAMGTVYLAYRTGKTAGGRICGITALIFTAFWPSQILFSNAVASEFVFSFLLMLCLYLFVKTLKAYPPDTNKPVKGVMLHVLIGILLAVASAVRPAGLILLIAIVICILPEKMRLPVKLPAHQPLSLRILGKGWMRCLVILVTFFCVSSFISMRISYTIDQEIVTGVDSLGYSLMTGLNEESLGSRNQEDADYLRDTLEEKDSVTEAFSACLERAAERLKNPVKLLDLFIHKFQAMWADDGYANVCSITFMEQQGTLTTERAEFLNDMTDISNLYYLLVVSLAGIAGIFLWKRGNGIAYPFILVILGTAGMHLFVESQNRYHYHALIMIAFLASYTVKEIYEMNRAKILASKGEKERGCLDKEEDKKKMELLLQEEEELKKIRKEAMGCRFDMMDALKKGYITVSVSEAYVKEAQSESVNVDEEKEDEQKQDGEKA